MSAPISRGRCPQCQSALRIPASWVGQMVRCKRCDTVVQVTAKPQPVLAAAPAPAAVVPAPTPVPVPAPAESDPFPEWPAPAAPVPYATPPAGPANDLDFGGPPVSGIQIRRPVPKGMSGVTKALLTLGGLALVAGATAGGFMLPGLFPEAGKGDDTKAVVGTKATDQKANTSRGKRSGTTVNAGTAFPRRLMAISVNQYLYANPTQSGSATRGVTAWTQKIGTDKLKVPKEQVYVVSDSGADPHPPLKPIIEQSIDKFLSGSRPQDRVVLLFVGHAIEIEGESFLVPLEGDFAIKESLIPLKWVYDKLAACPARQKLFMVDVCRYDPTVGLERPGSGPMGEKLSAMLMAPPAGVQVWSACSAKEYSYEFVYEAFEHGVVEGGLALNTFFTAFQQGQGIPKPDETIPIALFQTRVKERVEKAAERLKAKQTPFLAGAEPADGAAFNPADALAARVELPTPAKLAGGGIADRMVVKRLLDEIVLPPAKQMRGEENTLAKHLEQVFPFPQAALDPFAPDYATAEELTAKAATMPLRKATMETVEALRRHAEGKVKINGNVLTVSPLKEDFPAGKTSDKDKKGVAQDQRDGPGRIMAELLDLLEAMEKAGKSRDQEPSKRWQLNYDYVYAQLKARYAYVSEYNLMFGKIRKDELPPLDEKIHKGWRLAAQEKLTSTGDVKAFASDAKKTFERIAKDHPDTPWAILAKQAKSTAIGLKWEPASFGEGK